MIKISQKQQKLLVTILPIGSASSSAVHAAMIKEGENISLVTVKRTLSHMADSGVLRTTGSGRSTRYEPTIIGRTFADVNARTYCALDPDTRYGLRQYNFDLLPGLPKDVFTPEELKIVNGATKEYKKRTKDLPPAIQKKELERLIIELSWKSSKIEGNTYTLLDTEKLILENKAARGHDRKEAQMILNHKDAFQFVRENAAQFKTLTRKNLEVLHAIVVKNLDVGIGLRQKPVGVVGSVYRPLDNIHQIIDAVDGLGAAVSRMRTPYEKALVALLGVSYIQPFEDGNKRTGRLIANALLLAHAAAPLSYRSVDENEYRDAILVFYELNSLVPFKKIFIAQYDFAARNYAVT